MKTGIHLFLICVVQQFVLFAQAQSKPNIVFILMDNLGYGEVGCYGGGITRGAATPRIDKLATEGTRLLNFNVEAQCTPSRSAILTGTFFYSFRYTFSSDRWWS
jgi:arylsulfatase